MSSRSYPPRERWRSVVGGVGELLITLGVVLLLFVVYELWFTNIATDQAQKQLTQQFQHLQTTLPRTATGGEDFQAVPPGGAYAIVYIPKLGRDYHKVVVQGTAYADLAKGPGHYDGTANPGEIGNFAVAGHRTTHGAPFNRLDVLRPGDYIVVETATEWFTYEVEDIPGTSVKYQEIVDPSDVSVVYPVPDASSASVVPTKRLLTFTTCNPKYSARQRLVVHALLVSSQAYIAGGAVPPALTPGH